MENTLVEVCGVCMKQYDKCDSVEVEWIECDNVNCGYMHASCIDADSYDDDNSYDYLCWNCLD